LSFHGITRANFFSNPPFVGFDNYIKVLGDRFFLDALRVSICWVALTTIAELLLGLGLGLLMNQEIPWKSSFTILLLTPMVISPVATSYMFGMLLNNLFGPISILLRNIFGVDISLIGDPSIAFFTVAVLDIWQWTPFMFLLIYTGIRSLPNEPLEAAMVDGASPWQILTKVKLPLLKPIIAVALIFRMMDSFKTFDVIYVLTGGGPGRVTETISVYIYRTFSKGDIGLMLALSTALLMIIPLLSRFYMRYLYEVKK
jgi:multiple sugar transport system permease protein